LPAEWVSTTRAWREYIKRVTDETAGLTAARSPDRALGATDELGLALAHGDRLLGEDGDLRSSRHYFERTYQLAEPAGDVRAAARAALGLAGLWVSESRTAADAAHREERLRHVLPLLPADSVLARRVRVRLAAEADYLCGENAAIRPLLDELGPDADPVLLAEALSLAHHCLLGPDHVGLREELAARLIRTSFRSGRRGDLLMGLLWQTVDCFTAGDPHAERRLSELRAQLRQRAHLAVGFVVSAIDVMLAIRAGQLDQAEALAETCAKSGVAAGDIDSEWWPAAQLVTIRWYQGRLGELLPVLRDRAQSPVLSAVDNSALAALAVAAAVTGDDRTAVSSLATLCGSDLGGLARSSSWLVTMNGIVQAAYLLGQADVAEQAYALLRPYASLPMVGSLGVTCFGSTEQALGVAALTVGRLDQAVCHLRAAVQHNLALAHWPAVLASRHRLARAYLLRGAPGDTAAARRELDAVAGEGASLRLPPPSEPVSRPHGELAECDRRGRKWRVALDNRSVLVEDSIGLTYLAVLIASPRQEILATDLAAGLILLGHAATSGAVQPVLDRTAVSEYRSRLSQLDAQLEQFEAGDNPARAGRAQAERARAERDWLTGQLASAAGLGGRTRAFPDQGERARVAVGKAIRRALARVDEADAVIGGHLRQAVRTGARCSYWPG
jgi:hypothetical protein